jgi:hypothetical protein
VGRYLATAVNRFDNQSLDHLFGGSIDPAGPCCVLYIISLPGLASHQQHCDPRCLLISCSCPKRQHGSGATGAMSSSAVPPRTLLALADAELPISLDNMIKLASAWLGRREAVKAAGRRNTGHGLVGRSIVLAPFPRPAPLTPSSVSVRLSRRPNWGATRLKRGRRVTTQAQNIPRFGSMTPYRALSTLSYVLSLDWVDRTTVRRRRMEMMQALCPFSVSEHTHTHGERTRVNKWG